MSVDARVMLVRSWNLFHGNSVPPRREAYLDEMIVLATADDPDVLCVQEVPAWALTRFTVSDVAARPNALGLPIGATAGRLLTAVHHGLLRSAFSGQGNAMWVSPRLRVVDHRRLPLNPRSFRRLKAREWGLSSGVERAWARERRIVQTARIVDPGGAAVLVANLHCTSYARDRRLADAELLRAAWFATGAAEPNDAVVLAGDFNVTPEESETLRTLTEPEWGFSAPGPGIDQVLVNGADAGPLVRWPDEQRRRGDALLSDHAPVERVVGGN
jgi:endonuclease/exonuclease/phosphatase family metal-dependent hydrolase